MDGNGVIYISQQTFEDILCGRKRIVKPGISRVVRMAYEAPLNAVVVVVESPDLPAVEQGKVMPNVSAQVEFEEIGSGV